MCWVWYVGFNWFVQLLTEYSFGVQPRAYNRTELEDILGLVGKPNADSQDSRPLLLSIVESFLNEVGEVARGSDCPQSSVYMCGHSLRAWKGTPHEHLWFWSKSNLSVEAEAKAVQNRYVHILRLHDSQQFISSLKPEFILRLKFSPLTHFDADPLSASLSRRLSSGCTYVSSESNWTSHS